VEGIGCVWSIEEKLLIENLESKDEKKEKIKNEKILGGASCCFV
jgi:hypothetical protein